MQIKPYKEKETTKKSQVGEMFDRISPRYDFLNKALSLGIDRVWRRKTVRLIAGNRPLRILDVATGTADLAINLARKIDGCTVMGTDISEGMLEIGRNKIAHHGLSERISLAVADAENLPFAENEFDAVTAAFGVRNFENTEKGVSEMYRILKKNGMVCILEFSMPENKIISSLYKFYFFRVLPFFGGIVSKDREAYAYLPESVEAFPSGKYFISLLEECGFSGCFYKKMTFGIASIYCGYKR